MHFINRALFATAPTGILNQLHVDEQPIWLQYKNWLNTKIPPTVPKPSSKWTRDTIRDPLTELFRNNCAYCGIYTDKNHDGEVDHFFPKELDTQGDSIYSWDNYVWSCHSCNNKKRSNYPLINPCNENETKEIYFHSADGRYVVKSTANQDIKDKFQLTEQKTYLNGKRSPDRRKFIAKHLKNIMTIIYDRSRDYEIERILDSTTLTCAQSLNKLNVIKVELREYLKSEDFILLKNEIFAKFRIAHPNFAYTYEDFI